MTTDDDGRRELAKIAGALARQVGDLSLAVTAQGQRADKQSKILRLTVFGLVLDVVLSLALGVSYYQQAVTSTRLSMVVNGAFCPLYQIFVSSFNPDSLAARSQGIGAYTSNFNEIKRQYGVLQCAPIRPK